MKITLELGIPYRDILSMKEISIDITTGTTIKDVMEAFLASYPYLVEQALSRGYYDNGKLKAIYTRNSSLVSINEKVEDGDRIKIIIPIVGG